MPLRLIVMTQWMKTQDNSYTLYNAKHDQTYHSTAGAWQECFEVFFLPFYERKDLFLQKEWKILDVGFGLGLNWLFFINASLQLDKNLTVVSLENDKTIFELSYPLQNLPHEIRQNDLVLTIQNPLEKIYQDFKQNKIIETQNINAKIHLDDAHKSLNTLIQNKQKFDLILQDPFSPQKNPNLWNQDYFHKIAKLCHKKSLLTTYSSARIVQDGLKNAGFEIQKLKGFAGKRERVIGIFQNYPSN